MSRTLVRNYIHIVFSTKNRLPLIKPVFQTELFYYMTEICNNLGCEPLKIGGYTDHVHILCLLSKRIALVKLVEELKSHSSKWIKSKNLYLKNFYWQTGYSVFSINPTEVEIAKNYIGLQNIHHQTNTFQDEYRAFLKKYNIEIDERTEWD